MKIKILLISTWCFMAAVCYGQSPIKFTDTSNKWKVLWYLKGIPFPVTRTFFFNGDSVPIDGKYFQSLSYITEGQDNTTIKKSDMFFRQEGAKIYKSYGNDKPYLIYDFDLSIDSALYPNAVPLTYFQKVDNIDSITLDNGSKAKRMYIVCNVVANPNPSAWIEGIGDVTNPFTPEPQCSLFDPNEFETLMCFSTQGEIVFKNEKFPDCNIEGQLQHISFVDTANRWHIIYYNNPFFEKRIYFLKDLFNLDGYKQFHYYLEDNPLKIFQTNNYVKEERERVLFKGSNNVEEVLYDMSLNVDDVFYTSPNSFFSQTVLEKSRSTLMDGSMVRSILAACNIGNGSEKRIWLEGIGNNRFPINVSRYCYADASGEDEYFLCFSRFGKTLYTHRKYNDCKFLNTYDFVSKNNEWIHKTYEGPNTYSYKSKFDFNDSTIVNGNIYYALKSTNEQFSDIYNLLNGYYRQQDNKVYEFVNGNEIIKYDFNLIVGDTFEYKNDNGNLVKYKVKDVTYQAFYSNTSLSSKIITLQCLDFPDYTFKWIQGIGEEESGDKCLLDGINTYLSCFSHNGIMIYKSKPLEKCWLVNTDERNVDHWEIYPNPAYDKLIINSDVSINGVEIFTLEGKRHIASWHNDGIDISALPAGIYTVKILFGNGYVGVKKFIKSL